MPQCVSPVSDFFFSCFELEIIFWTSMHSACTLVVVYHLVSLCCSFMGIFIYVYGKYLITIIVALLSDLLCFYNLDMSAIFMFK